MRNLQFYVSGKKPMLWHVTLFPEIRGNFYVAVSIYVLMHKHLNPHLKVDNIDNATRALIH